MDKAKLINRFKMIFTNSEIERISFDMKDENIETIKVDVHGLKCASAKRFINNIINLIMDAFKLIVIHGFNHGTAIRDMLRGNFFNHKVENFFCIVENDGVTYLVIHSYI
nr:hypothetical protein [uncultured Anaerobutyricum sp.]